MSINFTNQTVSINTVLSFEQMGTMQELLEMAAMEAVEGGNAVKTSGLCDLANALDIALDVDSMESSEPTANADNGGNDQDDDLDTMPHSPQAD